MNETPEKKTSAIPPASLPASKDGVEKTNEGSAKDSPLGMSLEEAYAQMEDLVFADDSAWVH